MYLQHLKYINAESTFNLLQLEWWISKRPWTAGGKATEWALYGKMQTTNSEMTMIYWDRTPWDLWHCGEGQRPYSIHPSLKWEHPCSQNLL